MTKPKKHLMRITNESELSDIKGECIEVKEEKGSDKDMKNEKLGVETELIDVKNLKVEIGHKNVPESSVSAANSPRTFPEGLWDNHVNSTALQIIDVIGEGEGESCVWAIQLVRETLHSAREGDQLLVISYFFTFIYFFHLLFLFYCFISSLLFILMLLLPLLLLLFICLFRCLFCFFLLFILFICLSTYFMYDNLQFYF